MAKLPTVEYTRGPSAELPSCGHCPWAPRLYSEDLCEPWRGSFSQSLSSILRVFPSGMLGILAGVWDGFRTVILGRGDVCVYH